MNVDNNRIIITKADIIEGLQRESSLLSVNLNDDRGVSMYDRVFVENDALLYGVITEAVGNITQEAMAFVQDQTETNQQYQWTLTKVVPMGINKDVLEYIVCYAMHEWFIKSLNKNGQGDSFDNRAALSMKNILKKLYFKSAPM